MRLDLRTVDTLPRLAWVAAIRRNEDTVQVLHGPWVETREDRFFEGAWDGPFPDGAFDDALALMGSGGRIDGDRIVFAGPSHKMDRIQSLLAGETLYVSNSFPLLLARTGEELDLSYPNYFFDYLRYFRAGIRITVKPVRLRSGNHVYLHDYCNLAVKRSLAVERLEKRIPPPPSCYQDYADFLQGTARQVSANATDPARQRIFRPVAAISRGYDSVAVAALASRANCRRSVTFRHSRTGNGSLEDSGAQIAAHLGMHIREYDRADYIKLPGLPEIEFYPAPWIAAKTLTVLEDQLAGSLFFNGQGGEDYWDATGGVFSLLQEPGALTMSGSNLTEFRLRAGVIVFPLASCGAIHAPIIARIGRSSEMKNWSVGGKYDRPIPRRLAEDRGVPRDLFGQIKAGGAPYVGEIGLCPASDADFGKFCAHHIQGKIPSGEQRFRSRIRYFLRRVFHRRPWSTRLALRIAGDRLDPRWGSVVRYTFHWSVCRMQERYQRSLQGGSALHSAPNSSDLALTPGAAAPGVAVSRKEPLSLSDADPGPIQRRHQQQQK